MNLQKLMKQAQQMQKEMARAQEELQKEVVEASSGGGVVQVKVNGMKEIVELKIDPEAVNKEDVEMLEDMISAAINEAMRKIKKLEEDKLGGLTQGMGIPGF